MTEASYSYTATGDNFDALVVDNSAKGPVLVNYWAPWAGPCMMLLPDLEDLAAEFQGRFLLVHVNTDEQKPLVRSQGIRSLPSLRLYHQGKVAQAFHGGQPKAELRRVLERYIERPVHPYHAAAVAAYREGDMDQALELFARASEQDPENLRLALDRAKALLKAGRPEDALEVLSSLPAVARDEGEIGAMQFHLQVILATSDGPDPEALKRHLADRPDDLDSRFQLAAARLVADEYPAAVAQLQDIARRDPEFRDGIGPKGLRALSELLGKDLNPE